MNLWSIFNPEYIFGYIFVKIQMKSRRYGIFSDNVLREKSTRIFITNLENNKKTNTQDTNGAALSHFTVGITTMQNWKINFGV